MEEQLLKQFIEANPKNYMSQYFRTLLNINMIDYETVKEAIDIAKRAEHLSSIDREQCDILLVNYISHIKPSKILS